MFCGKPHFTHQSSLSHGPAESWQRRRFPVPGTTSSLRLLRDPVQGVGSASCSEPGPLTALPHAAAGIPWFRGKQKRGALLLCHPPTGRSRMTICTAQVRVPAHTPRATWQSSHTAPIVRPGCSPLWRTAAGGRPSARAEPLRRGAGRPSA